MVRSSSFVIPTRFAIYPDHTSSVVRLPPAIYRTPRSRSLCLSVPTPSGPSQGASYVHISGKSSLNIPKKKNIKIDRCIRTPESMALPRSHGFLAYGVAERWFTHALRRAERAFKGLDSSSEKWGMWLDQYFPAMPLEGLIVAYESSLSITPPSTHPGRNLM